MASYSYDVMMNRTETSMIQDSNDVIELYFPKIMPFISENDIIHSFQVQGIATVENITFVPRLHNNDNHNAMMGFARVRLVNTVDSQTFKNNIQTNKSFRLNIVSFTTGTYRGSYLMTYLNKNPKLKEEKQEAGTCVMDIISQQTTRIKDLEETVSTLTKAMEQYKQT
jgi:hypothetical protein